MSSNHYDDDTTAVEVFDIEQRDDDEEDEEETGFNEPRVTLDGEEVATVGTLDWRGRAEQAHAPDPYDLERVQVSFPAAENGEQEEADERAPLGWCNSAAISLDRKDDAVHLSISVGDPRGAFVFTVRRLSDGSLVMHFPTPEDGQLHMPLTPLHNGTYKVGF